MKTIKIVLLILTLLLALLGRNSLANASDSDTYVIRHINVVDVAAQRVVSNQRVWVQGSQITHIEAENVAIDTAIKQIEGNNGYLTPGLMDMHMHAWDPAAFAINLSYGVTHVRIMNGVPEHLRWQQQLASQQRWGSTVTVSSPILSGYQDAPLHTYVGSKEQAREAVASAARHGYDVIKTYGSLSAQAFAWIREFAAKAGIPVTKHGPHPAGDNPDADNSTDWSVLMGLQSLEHVEDIFQGPLGFTQNPEKLADTASKLAELQVPVTPTLNIYRQLTLISAEKNDFIARLPADYISPLVAWFDGREQVQRWLDAPAELAEHNQRTLSYLQTITGELFRAGVPILAGSDAGVLLSPHGLALHEELALLHASGLPVYEVLRAATINPARALAMEHQSGQIKAGFNADMIYTRVNPIADLGVLSRPDAVIKHGQWFDQPTLEQKRQQAIDNRSLFDEAILLISNM